MRPLEQFLRSTEGTAPAADLPAPLAALWWLYKGDWDRAHGLVQAFDDGPAAWVHAHLHRVEGDAENAAYWYRRAGRSPSARSLREEWTEIADALLNAG